MNKYQITLLLIILLMSCNNKNTSISSEDYDYKIYYRNGFYVSGIFINYNGNSYAFKQKTNYYQDSLILESINEKKEFSIVSKEALSFLKERMDFYKENKKITSGGTVGGARFEVFYKNEKIIDTYKITPDMWQFILKIAPDIPKAYNPFQKGFEFEDELDDKQ